MGWNIRLYNGYMTSLSRLAGSAVAVAVGLALLGVGSAAFAQLVPPTAPTGVTASLSGSHVTVSWTAPASTSTPVAGYYVYRNGGVVANTAGTSVADTVGPGVYTYTVAAYDASDNVMSQSQASSPISVVADAVSPSAPTGLTVTSMTSSSIALSWSAASDNVGVTGYYLVRDGSRVVTASPITGTSYTDTGLMAGTPHIYQVNAYDAAGNVSGVSNTVRIATLSSNFTVSTPYNVTALAVSTSEVDIAWGASVDASGTPLYYVIRNGIPFATTSATSYRDIGLAPNTRYWYNVTAYDAAGNVSSQSDAAGTSTFALSAAAAIVAPPAAVGGVNPAVSVTARPDIVAQPSSSSALASTPVRPFTATLSLGSRGDAVTALQEILIARGYLGAQYATGYYGALTQKAVQQFQCARSVICSGSPRTTGWGMIGPKTRSILNAGE